MTGYTNWRWVTYCTTWNVFVTLGTDIHDYSCWGGEGCVGLDCWSVHVKTGVALCTGKVGVACHAAQ